MGSVTPSIPANVSDASLGPASDGVALWHSNQILREANRRGVDPAGGQRNSAPEEK